MKITKNHEPLSSAKAVAAFLIFSIAAVLFFKFITNRAVLANDPESLRNYVMFSIVVGGFLIGLLYLTSQTKHKTKPAAKSSKKKKK